MTESQKQGWSFVGFPIAGLLSGFLFVFLYSHDYFGAFSFSTSVAAAVFGALNGICMYYFLNLDSVFGRVVFFFVVVSVFAWNSSVLVAEFVFALTPDHHLSILQTDPTASFFAGGFVGGFILLAGALRLVFPTIKLSAVFWRSFSGALVGGLLGISGSGFRFFYALWQTGMAFVLCLVLWI